MSKHTQGRAQAQKRTNFSHLLQANLAQAKAMIEKDQFQEVIRLLDPLADTYTRSADLHNLLGMAYEQTGELWSSVKHYEKALSLRSDGGLLVSLGFLYFDLELNVLALYAFRKALKTGLEKPLVTELQERAQLLEDEILATALLFNLSPDKIARGLRLFEEAQIALHNHAYAHCIHLNRRASQLLGDFPPAENNLSLALFFHGMPEDAIRTARQVIARYPDNIQALSNLVRFLSWTGEVDEAHQVWGQLRKLTPLESTSRMKMVEAAAMMDADEDVYRLLQERDDLEESDQGLTQRAQLYLAVAEANTGRKAARRRLKELQKTIPWAELLVEALQAGKRGLGWAERFPYFHASELLPQREMEAFLELLGREDEIPAAKFRREVERYAARYPQLVLVGKKFLLEDQQTEAAIALLTTLATSEAFAVLREFSLGQMGDDDSRLQALSALIEAGEIEEHETVRFWRDGEWHDIQVRKYAIVEGRKPEYAPEVIDLLEEALLAFQENRLARAEKLYKRILALEPNAKEACNNLATLYARQDKHAQAQKLFKEAIALDQLYVMPRCNLAMYLLDEDKVEEAEAMIAPLVDVPQLHPQELAFLSYVRARIHIEYDEYDQAKKTLEMALKVYPDYEPAAGLLDRLSTLEYMKESWAGFWEQQHQRNLARRERQRSQLSTPDPTLAESLGIYSKDILTAIARRIIPWGGWSALKKAELHQHLVDYLLDGASLDRVLASLTDEERTAFELVQANGGALAWNLFDQNFDNDLDESPHWQYHEPESVMGRLRAHGLLVEVYVEGKLLVSIPVELRKQTQMTITSEDLE